MSSARVSMLVLAAALGAAASALAQVPDDLRAAMRARDTAFYAVDPAVWEKHTAAAFTTVQREVWTRETGTWMVLMSQVTTAKP